MYFFFTAKNKTKQGETHFKNYQCALLRAIVVIWFFSLKENLILSFELVISDVFFFFTWYFGRKTLFLVGQCLQAAPVFKVEMVENGG